MILLICLTDETHIRLSTNKIVKLETTRGDVSTFSRISSFLRARQIRRKTSARHEPAWTQKHPEHNYLHTPNQLRGR